MNQILKGKTSIKKLMEEMEKNNVNEITRIIFLPKTSAVIISFNIEEMKGGNHA